MKQMAYQINELNFEPIIITFSMNSFLQPESLYFLKLDEWCRDKGADAEAYFPVFCKKLESFFQIGICFDNRVLAAVNKLLKNSKYIEFSAQSEHRSPLKAKLKQVVRVLAIYEFISHRNCQILTQKMAKNYFKDKIGKYISIVEQKKKRQNVELDSNQLSNLWRLNLQLNFQQTWNFLSNSNIYDPTIIELYETSKSLIKSFSIQRIHSIDQYIQRVEAKIAQRNSNAMIIQLFPPCSNQKKNWQYSDAMDKFITKLSLFLNNEKLELAIQQIWNIVDTIKKGVPFENALSFQLFGSMKTGFALINDSDGDIELIIKNETLNRQRRIQYLEVVYQALRKNGKGLLEYQSIQPFVSQKIRNPFLKIKFEKHFNFNKENKNILKCIDLVLNTPGNLKNSKIIQLYGKSDYIIKFCNFVKLWARRKYLIDSKTPKQSLTSYAALLMALFYLIKTNQAPFIVENADQFHLEKNLMNDKQYSSLFDNFKGFLEFYRYNGRFFMENMVVCLKESFVETPYTRKYLINIHDLVDHTNSGRIGKQLGKKFFSVINKTYIQLISYQSLNDILKYEQYKPSDR